LGLLELAGVVEARDRRGDRVTAGRLAAEAVDLLDACGLTVRAACARALAARVTGMPRAALHEHADHWLLTAPSGDSHRLRPLRGFGVLRELLRASGPVSALELLWAVEPPDGDPTLRSAIAAQRGTPVVDQDARDAYVRRVAELEAALDAADRAGDVQHSDSAARELAALRAELRRTQGLGVRTRRAPDAVERARVSVTKLVRRAVAAVGDADAGLGEHLDRSIVTGTECSYTPGAGERIDWDVG
jgi:hypothetical protein